MVRENAGNGGSRYSLIFEGENRFKGKKDTLQFSTQPDATTDEIRQLLLKYLGAGLMPYVARTPVFSQIKINFTQNQQARQELVEDKWHSWVFDISASAHTSGETRYKSLYARASFNATKITNDWILDFYFSSRINSSSYVINENYTVKSFIRSYNYNGLIVRSINEHWSIGAYNSVLQSTYNNYKISAMLQPAIEYNFLPYSEATVHQFTVLYRIGPIYNQYFDTTIYNKTEEFVFRNSLKLTYATVKKWGSIRFSVNSSAYMDDWKKNSTDIYASFRFRIVKGLSLNLSGSYGFIHDQINLPKGDLSLEEILTEQQVLQTSYNYFLSVGISYTFGAIYNNIVNPRFGRGGNAGYVIYF